MNARSNLSWAGVAAGAALAPFTAAGSYLRKSRLFHPTGVVLRGSALPANGSSAAERAIGERLAGPVFVRFSGGWWKVHEWPDVLGCALRFSTSPELGLVAGADDQDLLLATIRNPLTTLLAPLSTHVADYLQNDYFGVSPFRVPVLGRVKLRLVPAQTSPAGATREQRMNRALERGPVVLTLELRDDRLAAEYRPLVHIELSARVELEPAGLRFDPFASGRGLEPVGFVHAMRVASYAASRRARAAALTVP